MGSGSRYDVGVRHDVSGADRKAAARDQASASKARDFDHGLRCVIYPGRIHRSGEGQARRERGLQAREHRRNRNARQDSLHAGQEAGCLGRALVERLQHCRPLDLLRDLLAGASREGQTQEPAHRQHRHDGHRSSGNRVGHGVHACPEDVAADRLARGEADARPEASTNDQHKNGAEWARHRVVDLEVVQRRCRRGRSQQHADHQARVLGC